MSELSTTQVKEWIKDDLKFLYPERFPDEEVANHASYDPETDELFEWDSSVIEVIANSLSRLYDLMGGEYGREEE